MRLDIDSKEMTATLGDVDAGLISRDFSRSVFDDELCGEEFTISASSWKRRAELHQQLRDGGSNMDVEVRRMSSGKATRKDNTGV